MASIQCRELIAKSDIFEKHHVTTAEEAKDSTRQKKKRAYYGRVLSRFSCELQCRILLKSQTDRILAIDSRKEGCWHLDSHKCGVLFEDFNGIQSTV